jgi:hypothetical protein
MTAPGGLLLGLDTAGFYGAIVFLKLHPGWMQLQPETATSGYSHQCVMCARVACARPLGWAAHRLLRCAAPSGFPATATAVPNSLAVVRRSHRGRSGYRPGAYDLAPSDCRVLDLGLPRALGAHTRVDPRRRDSPLLSGQRGCAASTTRSGGCPPNTGE